MGIIEYQIHERMLMSERKDVPYIVYENEMYRHERTVKRLLIVLCIACIMIVVTNSAWLYVFSQYDFETYSLISFVIRNFRQSAEKIRTLGISLIWLPFVNLRQRRMRLYHRALQMKWTSFITD